MCLCVWTPAQEEISFLCAELKTFRNLFCAHRQSCNEFEVIWKWMNLVCSLLAVYWWLCFILDGFQETYGACYGLDLVCQTHQWCWAQTATWEEPILLSSLHARPLYVCVQDIMGMWLYVCVCVCGVRLWLDGVCVCVCVCGREGGHHCLSVRFKSPTEEHNLGILYTHTHEKWLTCVFSLKCGCEYNQCNVSGFVMSTSGTLWSPLQLPSRPSSIRVLSRKPYIWRSHHTHKVSVFQTVCKVHKALEVSAVIFFETICQVILLCAVVATMWVTPWVIWVTVW